MLINRSTASSYGSGHFTPGINKYRSDSKLSFLKEKDDIEMSEKKYCDPEHN